MKLKLNKINITFLSLLFLLLIFIIFIFLNNKNNLNQQDLFKIDSNQNYNSYYDNKINKIIIKFNPFLIKNNYIDDINLSKNICYNKTIKIVNGKSMEPLINEGTELTLLEGYYKCNPVKRNDIVAYDYKGNKNPIIKRVAIIGGDTLKWKKNKLLVNEKILINSEGKPYTFTSKEKKIINLYIKNGKLIENSYLLFSEMTSGSIDSRKFGAVGKKDIIGKFDYNYK